MSTFGFAVTDEMVGGAVLAMVNVMVRVALLPAASVTVTVMRCWPRGNIVPAAGLWVTTSWFAGVQLSDAVTPATTLGTAPSQFASAEAVNPSGKLAITGTVESTTINETLVEVLLPDASVMVIMIEC